MKMDDREFNNVYAIPANYTDSGKLMGGLLEPRNTVEAILLVGLIGYPELMWISVPATMKIVMLTVTLLPVGILALMGVGGSSLMQYFSYIVRFWLKRRKLHLRRIGYKYAKTKKAKKAK